MNNTVKRSELLKLLFTLLFEKQKIEIIFAQETCYLLYIYFLTVESQENCVDENSANSICDSDISCLGLTYMNARWMDNNIGRFISPDPLGQGINYYIYAGNNPTTFIDPSGLYYYSDSWSFWDYYYYNSFNYGYLTDYNWNLDYDFGGYDFIRLNDYSFGFGEFEQFAVASFAKPYKFWKDDSFFTKNWWLPDEKLDFAEQKLVIAEQILYSEIRSNGAIDGMDLQINKEFNKLWTIRAGMGNTTKLRGEGWTGDALDTLANLKTRYNVPEERDKNNFSNQNIVDIETMQAIMDATATRFDLYNNHPLLGTLNEFFTYSGLAENYYRASVMLPVMYYSFKPNIARTKVPNKALNTLKHVKTKGVAPSGFKGGRIFKNYEGKLPGGVTYKEWDVNVFQKGISRGAERLVTGSDGSAFYTFDHYKTFIQIK